LLWHQRGKILKGKPLARRNIEFKQNNLLIYTDWFGLGLSELEDFLGNPMSLDNIKKQYSY